MTITDFAELIRSTTQRWPADIEVCRHQPMSLDDKTKPLFEAVEEMATEERAGFLSENLADRGARAAGEDLLANHENAGAVLAEPAAPGLSAAVNVHVPLLQSGTLLAGRFRIVRFIAHGGMGELYQAEDLELHESLAIKILRPEILQQPKAIDRFKREVHLSRNVTHPNVCRVFDLFRDRPEGKEEIVFVTMELLKGETLADRMRRSGRMNPEESLPLIRHMASALGAAHEAGIVHRDFKPGNVMLVDDLAGPRAVVTDFGLAFREANSPGSVNGASWESVSACVGALYGTLAYMAPEQIEGRAATAASDIYSFGLVIYEMVTGSRPFTSDTPMAAAVKRLIEPPPAPRLLDSKLDPAWEYAILRCLERDPRQRFTTAQGVIDALAGNAQQLQTGKEKRQALIVRQRPLGYRYILLTGIAAIAIAGSAVGFRYYSHRRTNAPLQPTLASGPVSLRPAVAVLGFKNLSRKPDAEWLSTALSETLNTELALGEKLRTIPGETVARTKLALSLPDEDSYGQDTLARIRSNMNTDIVVLGSYLDSGKKSGGHVRIDLRAQDTRTGNTIAVISENGTEAQVLDLILRTGAEVREKLGAGADAPAVNEAVRTSEPSSSEVARLYSEGLKKLWLYDSVGAKGDLERAVSEEPAFPLSHDALARAWFNLGYGENAREEADKAFQLSAHLSREQRLLIEGHDREINHQWEKAIALYSTLFNFFPDNLDYGNAEARAERLGGKEKEALRTIEKLRSLPAPARDDPRTDNSESMVAWAAGDFRQAKIAAEQAERKGRALQAPLVIAVAQTLKCMALERLGDFAQAVANCEDAEQAYSKAGDLENQGRALLNLRLALQDQGDFTRAQDALQRAVVIFGENGDKLGQASAMSNSADSLGLHGDHLAAAHTYEQALALLREIDDKPGMLRTINSLAAELGAMGNLAGSTAEYRRASSLAREIGAKETEAWATKGLGGNLHYQGDLPGSEKALNEALQFGQNSGEKRLLSTTLSTLGFLLEDEGKLDQAERDYKEGVRIANEIGEQVDTSEARTNLAEFFLSAGRPGESEALVRQAISVFQEAKSKDDETWASAVLARGLLAQGKTDEAARVINSVTIKGADTGTRFEFILALVRVRAASRKPEDQRAARKSINSMVAETTRDGFKEYELEARLALGEIEMKSNQAETGRRMLAALEKEARSRGFALIADKAAAAAKA
jgi:serine/threonine protein kinase/tetratricopeptide (TPR) repeat protein